MFQINATTHEYDCQHGESECEGNRLHSCAIKYIDDKVATLKYIACLDDKTSESSIYPISEVSGRKQ